MIEGKTHRCSWATVRGCQRKLQGRHGWGSNSLAWYHSMILATVQIHSSSTKCTRLIPSRYKLAFHASLEYTRLYIETNPTANSSQILLTPLQFVQWSPLSLLYSNQTFWPWCVKASAGRVNRYLSVCFLTFISQAISWKFLLHHPCRGNCKN